jgi:hypothetical protein
LFPPWSWREAGFGAAVSENQIPADLDSAISAPSRRSAGRAEHVQAVRG